MVARAVTGRTGHAPQTRTGWYRRTCVRPTAPWLTGALRPDVSAAPDRGSHRWKQVQCVGLRGRPYVADKPTDMPAQTNASATAAIRENRVPPNAAFSSTHGLALPSARRQSPDQEQHRCDCAVLKNRTDRPANHSSHRTSHRQPLAVQPVVLDEPHHRVQRDRGMIDMVRLRPPWDDKEWNACARTAATIHRLAINAVRLRPSAALAWAIKLIGLWIATTYASGWCRRGCT